VARLARGRAAQLRQFGGGHLCLRSVFAQHPRPHTLPLRTRTQSHFARGARRATSRRPNRCGRRPAAQANGRFFPCCLTRPDGPPRAPSISSSVTDMDVPIYARETTTALRPCTKGSEYSIDRLKQEYQTGGPMCIFAPGNDTVVYPP
ncbi:Protein of unknown function, partial [Gryllus bimaculatus]